MFNFQNTRYNRQVVMPEWGEEGQQKLAKASVVVIGAGGVKSTLLMALAACGIGRIRIIEFDQVELSNLNRQILYRTSDIGCGKGDCALRTLQDLNPDIHLELVRDKVGEDNIHKLLDDSWDFVVEGGESPAGRNLVNRFCLDVGKPFVHSSAQFSYGYTFSVIPSMKSACFACFFPNDHTRTVHTGAVPVNVLATSIAGSLGATEVVRWFLGHQESMMINRRIVFSSLLLSGEFSIEEQPRNEACPVCSHYYH